MSTEQIWFFLWERGTPSESIEPFSQGNRTLSQVKESGFTLAKCLELSEGQGSVDDHNFWLHSNSMKAAVQLLSDASIEATWSLYCQKDSVVTVRIRPSSDPSPNTSVAVSRENSLAERKKVSGRQRKVSDVFIRPQLDPILRGLDVSTQKPLRDFKEEERITIDLGMGEAETFSKEYLLGWITSQMSAGRDLTDIQVTALTKNKRPIEIAITDDVWLTSLLRGPWKNDFQALWETNQSRQYKKRMALDELKREPGFEIASKLFIRDLRCFGNDTNAQTRLTGTNHGFFLGQPFFTPATVDKILSLPFGSSTVKQELQDLAQRKTSAEHQIEICVSHDLAPFFEAVFGLDWKKLKVEMTPRVVDKIVSEIGKKGFGKKVEIRLKKAKSTLLGKQGENEK